MKNYFTGPLLFLFCSLACYYSAAQSKPSPIEQYYSNKDYANARRAARENIERSDRDANAYMILGRAYADDRLYDSSITFLQKAIDLDNDETYISGWSHAYLCLAYMKTGNTQKGQEEADITIKLNKTQNSVKFAKYALMMANDPEKTALGICTIKIETPTIFYYFEDTLNLGMTVMEYIRQRQSAYESINAIFNADMPIRLKFYVFTNREKAEKALGHPLGFSLPEKVASFSFCKQTPGHEMTHVLSHWAGGMPPKYTCKLINEGVAVCLDMTHDNIFTKACDAVKQTRFRGSLIDLWNNRKNYDDDIMYTVGGAFVRYLYANISKENFLKLMKNQHQETLQAILGSDYDAFITRFEQKIGIQ